jgi:dTDP-4-dehydrorhamnose 3,5-epimerase
MTSSLSSNGAPDRSDAPTKWRFTPLAIPEVVLVEAPRFGDARGWFSETYNRRVFARNGIDTEFVQDNVSFSAVVGTVRGLHYQSPPHAQGKLVRVLQGRLLDVAVDIRRGSATYGAHVTAELSAENGRQLYVPVGFAHGFVTREPDTIVAYKVTDFYAPHSDHGIFWADPALGIDWGMGQAEATLSAKDRALPPLAEALSCFTA